MFTFKKIIGILTKPGTLVLIILGYGLWRLAQTQGSRKKGWLMIGVGLAGFYLASTAPLPNYLIHTLESRYVPVNSAQNLTAIAYIVVLSEAVRLNDQVPSTSQLSGTTALRVAEGIRLFHLMSGSPVLFMSGGGFGGGAGKRMKSLAQDLGIPPEKLCAESQSKDTHDNALGVRAMVKQHPFLLVTSAAHMPRAMLIFQKLGMHPLAAPADYRYQQQLKPADFFPSAKNLATMESVIHEYLGLAYLRLIPGRAGE